MTDSEAAVRETHLLEAARDLAGLMLGWNWIDDPKLVIEDSRKGTPYYHVTTALEKVLQELGVGADDKMDFYLMVTTGMAPGEAVQRIKEFRQECDSEEPSC